MISLYNSSFSQKDQIENLSFDGYMLGAAVRQLNTGSFLIADIPFIEARMPLVTDVLQLKYGGHLMVGLSKFYAEWSYATGLQLYPLGELFSINISGQLGSFFLDNITYISSIGANFNYPISSNRYVTIGVEYFYRNSRDLFNYISFPVYGDNGEEAINLDSPGIAVIIGFRL